MVSEIEAFHIKEDPVTTQTSNRLKRILDAKYDAADLDEVCREQEHLSQEEQRKLHTLLNKYAPLFDGTLGTWRGSMVDLKLKPDAEPYHARPYPIPRVHVDTLRMEVERLCEIGVLKKVN